MSGTLTRQRRHVRVQPELPRLVGLDGVRAVAVIGVVLYHAGVPWFSGGFLGVDAFFVLSGFLITSLLLVELDRTGGIGFRRFYARRARRLLPALLAVLVVSSLLVASVAYDVAAAFRRDLPGALLYFANWQSILTDTSYFEFVGRPPMLKHLWSLAVEEQFYLLWPAAALIAHRWRGARAVGLVALVGALLSTVAMMVGSLVGHMPTATDPSRLYFGTDTHAMGVLLGAALAVVWRPGRTSPVLAPQARAVITAAGVAALALLVWFFHALGEYSAFLYRGGFLVVAAVSAVVVAAASHRGVPFGRWLGIRPLRWVGERSYGIYLWHWPLFLVTRPGTDLPLDGVAALALRIILLLAIAEVSYRYLEMPIRRGALGRFWGRVRAGDLAQPTLTTAAVAAALLAVVTVTGYRIMTAPFPAPVASGPGSELLPEQARLAPLPVPFEEDRVGVGSGRESVFIKGLLAGEPRALAEAQRRSERAAYLARPKASAFGDSVLLGAAPALERETFALDLHARVAEHASDVEREVRDQVAAGSVHDIAIVHMGNNGIVTEEQVRGVLDALSGSAHVVLVNVRVPKPWMGPNNDIFGRVAPAYPNVALVDWAGITAGHDDYLVSDGVHVTWRGAQAYTHAIAQAAGLGA